MYSVETKLRIVQFDLSPGLAVRSVMLSCDAGQWLLVKHKTRRVNNRYATKFCTHTTILLLTFTTVLNKLHEIFNILLQNRLSCYMVLPNCRLMEVFQAHLR